MSLRPADGPAQLRQKLLTPELNTSLTLSPDGRCVAFIRTVAEGQELWLRTVAGDEQKLTEHPGETVCDLRWTCDSSVLLYRYSLRGREYWTLTGLRIVGLSQIGLPATGSVTEYWLSLADPVALVYSSRQPTARYTELFQARIDTPIATPAAIAVNPGFHRWLVDEDLRPRGGTRITEDGCVEIVLGDNPDRARPVLTIATDDTVDLSIERFSRDGRQLYVLTSCGAKTRRLLAIDSATGVIAVVFEDPDLDIESYPIAGQGVWFDPRTGRPDICTVMDQRLRHHALTARHEETLKQYAPTCGDSPAIIGRSADDRVWLIVHVHDDAPIAYELAEPATGRTTPLLVNRPAIEGCELPKLDDFVFTASDGTKVGGYVMRPLRSEPPLPTVVLVHGGPAGRDYWRFHADAQYLAALGFQSLHINYRGSRGFGVDFRRAGHGEWGGRMQQDLYDAISSGVAAGLVDPERVAFFGSSYGGYAALLAACTRPDLVRCAVAISAPCDLLSFTEKPPPYWQSLAVLLRRQILTRRDGRQLDNATLRRRSPMHVLDAECAPVLLAHGVRDPRVPVREMDHFVARAEELGVGLRYLRFSDEGHHMKSNRNRAALFIEIADFLEVHLDHR